MDTTKAGGGNTKVLAVAIIIALLGVAFGGYYALQPKSVSTTTLTSTITGSATTVTSTATKTVSAGPQVTVSTVTVGAANYAADPVGMAFDPANNYMYVALENSSAVAVINAATNVVVTTISLPAGDAPVALAYDSANGMIYVANNNGACTSASLPTCTIPVINPSTNTVATNIATTDTTNGVGVLSGNVVLLMSNDDDAVFVVNGATNQLTGILQAHGSFPDNGQSIAVDPSTNAAVGGNWYKTRTAASIGFFGAPNSTGTNCLFKSTNESISCVTKSETIDGGRIDGIAINPNTGMIYLANYNAGVVNAISESTGVDIANISVPSPASVAVDPATNLIYVASNATTTNSVFAISGVTNAILTTVPVGTAPGFVAVDPGSNAVFVSNAASGTVSDFGAASISGPSALTVGTASSNPQGMTFDPTTNELYVALQGADFVAVINAATGGLVTTISLPSGISPVALAYDSANQNVYVANSASDVVPVISAATNTLSTSITVPDTTNGVSVYPKTNIIFLASNDDDAMFFINGTSSAVSILQIHTGIPDNAQAVAVDTSTEVAVVGNWYHTRTAAEIGFIGLQSKGGCLSTNTNSSFCVTKSLTLDGGQIDGVAVNPNTGLVYVANYKANVVNVISITSGKDLANVTAPSPVGVVVDPYSGLVYVASNATSTNSVIVISGLTNAVLANITVGNGPANLALDSDNNSIYVSSADNGTVSLIEGTSLIS